MKKISKIFLSLTSTCAFIAPALTTLTSCNSNDYSAIAEQIKTVAINEFMEIAKIPRPSHHCGKIYKYLMDRFTALGYEPKTDIQSGAEYGNIWVDIPATAGCENWDKIILQAHMDMVVVGVKAGEEATTPIIPVRETIEDHKNPGKMVDVIHSKDYKTSLGADNGIGLATILSICQNKNIKHGPIRAVITYDEEDGTYGAKALDISTVFDTKNIINIDAEVDGGLFVGCYGLAKRTYQEQFNLIEVPKDYTTYSIRIKDFTGGHSGEDVGFRRANAERLGWELIYWLNKLKTPLDTYLMHLDHWDYKEKQDSAFKHNSIIPYATFTIATKATKDEIGLLILTLLLVGTNKSEAWQTYYSGENWDIEHFEINEKEERLSSYTKCLSLEDTMKIATYMGGPLGEGLPCGCVMMKDEAKSIPAISGNVGPSKITISDSKLTWDSVNSSRTYVNEIIDWMTCTKEEAEECVEIAKSFNFETLYNKAFGKITGMKEAVKDHAWNDKADNPLREILTKGYKEAAKMEPKLVSAYGVLECSTWVEQDPTLNIVSIGPRLEDCHVQKETLYVDTLNNEYKAILYALNAMKK